MKGTKAGARRLMADSAAIVVAMEHRDQLGTMNIELAEAALSAYGRRLAVLDDNGDTGDLVCGMVEVLTSSCARLYGRRLARHRAPMAAGSGRRDAGPRALAGAGSVTCGGGG